MIGLENKTLASENLTFRLLKDCDKAALFPILGESETTRSAGFGAMVETEELEKFYVELTQYNTAVAILKGGECIGYIHVNKYVPDPPCRDARNIGIGFLIGKSHQRRGYGYEALRVMCAYLAHRFDNIWADYFIENIASGALLRKVGFKHDSEYELEFDTLGGEKKRIISTLLTREEILKW